jgi:iron complex outermembrane receptor protein
MNFRRQALCAAITLSVGLTASSSWAQLEEVIVTAQKKEQSLADVPLSITAITRDTIEALGIASAQDIGALTPNLQVSDSPGNAQGLTINMRGSVTINPALTLEPTVGVYLDGVYIGKNTGGIFDVVDLERVEVLRGPQGTLYGKNTLGGAVNFVSRKPSEELGGDVRVGGGELSRQAFRIRADVPLSSAVRTSFAYSQETRDGIVDNIDFSGQITGANPPSTRDFGNIDKKSMRIAIDADLSDSLNAFYNYDSFETDQNPRFFQMTRIVPVPGLTDGIIGWDSPNRFDQGSLDGAGADNVEVSGHSLTLTYTTDDFTIKSITGSRSIESYDMLDWDATPFHLLQTSRDVEYDSFSQEFQFLRDGENVSYVAGLYYFEEEGSVINPLDLPLYGSPLLDVEYGLDNQSWAVFAQADYTPSSMPDLTVTIGARYSEEDKTVYRSFGIPAFGLTVLDRFSPNEASYDNFSPSISSTYSVSDEMHLYWRVARGWKAGVFNAESNNPLILSEPIDEELVTSYEAGFKYRDSEGKLTLNASVFVNEIEDMQISRFNQQEAGSVFTNAGAATISGAEVEFAFALAELTTVGVNVGILDAEYDEYIDECRIDANFVNPCPAGVLPGNTYDAKDVNSFPYTPELTYNVFLQHGMTLAGGTLTARLDYAYTDDFAIFPDPYNVVNTSIDSYGLLNARLDWEGEVASQNVRVGIWSKNLTDEDYRMNGIEWGLLTTMQYGDPELWGIDLTVYF